MRKILFVMLSSLVLGACGNNATQTTETPATIAVQPVAADLEDGTPVLTETKDAAGKVLSSGYLLDGKKESSWLEYYDTGVLKTLITYYHDRKEGIAIEFTNNGSVSKRSNYHNDVRNGEYKEYNYGN